MSKDLSKILSCIIFGLAITLLLSSCAQIVAPTGGDPDEDPPVMDTLRSTPNFKTNFQKQDLVFYFDEWIELKNANEQVLISPEIKNSEYTLEIRKKSVVFSFNKDFELKDDITYIINFGESVVDFTAGNAVPKLRYVFSTGPKIDSLSFAGNVKDAVTGKPVEDAIVILNDNLSDTAFAKVNPLYIARTDETGNFQLDNLKSDTFQVCVLQNSAGSYLFDLQTTLSFGFLDSMIILDTNRIRPVQMWISENVLPQKMIKENSEQLGKITVDYKRSPTKVKVSASPPRQQFYFLPIQDSLVVWYTDPDTATWNLMLEVDSATIDTLTIVPNRLKTDLNFDLKPVQKIPETAQIQNPFDTLKVELNYPLLNIDESKILILEDSLPLKKTLSFEINPMDRRTIFTNYSFKPGSEYKIQLLPGALISMYQTTSDTLTVDLKMLLEEDLSNFILNLTNLDSTAQYIYSFETKAGRIIDKQILAGIASKSISYPLLDPLEYNASLILDRNANGVLDGGDFKLKRQPEKMISKEFGKLIANFDRTEDWLVPKLE